MTISFQALVWDFKPQSLRLLSRRKQALAKQPFAPSQDTLTSHRISGFDQSFCFWIMPTRISSAV